MRVKRFVCGLLTAALCLSVCLGAWAQDGGDAGKALPLLGGGQQTSSGSGNFLPTLGGGSSGGSSSGSGNFLPTLGSGSSGSSSSGGSSSGGSSSGGSSSGSGGSLPTLGGGSGSSSGSSSGSGNPVNALSNLLGGGSSSTSSSSSSSSGTKTHTVMIYVVGSDLETDYGCFTRDLGEIKASGVDLDRVNVVFCLGGASDWGCSDFDPKRPVMCALVRKGSGFELQSFGYTDDRNMADSDTLIQFLREAPKKYPADSYSLIFWNHGGGPIHGFGFDELTNDMMPMTDIVYALQKTGYANHRLDWIGFDACLMGSAEIASMLAPFARYMVASEESIPASGWDYSFMGSPYIRNGDTLSLLRLICDDYMEYYRHKRDIGLSVIDLSRMGDVEKAMDQVFTYPSGVSVPADLRRVAAAAEETKSFGRSSTSSSFDLYDLGDFADKMLTVSPSGAQALARAVDSAVVYHVTNMENASGMSFYFPLENRSNASGAVRRYKEFGFSGKYTSFLSTYVSSNRASGSKAVSVSAPGRAMMAPASSGEHTKVFTLQMTPEQMETYVRASYIIVTPSQDGTLELVRGGFGVTADENGLLSVEVDDRIHTIGSDTQEPMRFTLIETERSSSGIRYHLPFMLTRNYSPMVVSAQLETTQDNPHGTWGSMVPPVDGDFAPRMLLEFEPQDEVTLLQMHYTPTYDASGSILPFKQWESSGTTIYAANLLVGDGLEIACESAQGEYYVQINATDVYGDQFCSPLMPLTQQ